VIGYEEELGGELDDMLDDLVAMGLESPTSQSPKSISIGIDIDKKV
jgi:hypothetical protein